MLKSLVFLVLMIATVVPQEYTRYLHAHVKEGCAGTADKYGCDGECRNLPKAYETAENVSFEKIS
jgi:hypothetical protein